MYVRSRYKVRGKKSTKTAKKMTKKKPKGEETRSEDLGDSDEENKTTNNKTKNMDDDKGDVGKEKKNHLCDLSHYKAAFRELDIEVND